VGAPKALPLDGLRDLLLDSQHVVYYKIVYRDSSADNWVISRRRCFRSCVSKGGSLATEMGDAQ